MITLLSVEGWTHLTHCSRTCVGINYATLIRDVPIKQNVVKFIKESKTRLYVCKEIS